MSSKGRDLLKLSAVTGAAFALGLLSATALNLPRPGIAQQRSPGALAPAPPPQAPPVTLPNFADVVERVNPAVVYVRTGRTEPATRGFGWPWPPEFDQFFPRSPRVPRYREAAGSGFIVSEDGYILTNNHVVAGAERVSVTLPDNRTFSARVIGRDPNTDIAVIKIDAERLPAARLGNSDRTRIGDWVLAIGNPLGFEFSVTAGIVSAKGRALPGLVEGRNFAIQDFIQTDAAINPGNSGGPLVNLQGEVIGVNSAIASQTGYYAGYGFAIPINLARHVMDQLIAHGRVSRAILGVSIRDIWPEDAEYVGLPEIRGVVINEFTDRNSPARAAGLQPGDVIVALNDTAITHVAQLQQLVGFRRPGDAVRVTVVRRRGERRTLEVRLAEAPSESEEIATREGGDRKPIARARASGPDQRLGITVEPLTADLVRSGRLSADQRGVAVSDVDEGGPAWGRLVPPNLGPDVILWVNQERVRTAEDFEQAMRSVRPGEVVQLRVLNLQSGQVRIVRLRARS